MVAAIAACSFGCAAKVRADAPRSGRDSAGDYRQITIVSADGRPAPFLAVLAHRPTLINFWAPWCEPCVKELPDLESLFRAMSPCGAAVLGVAVGETPATIAAVVRARKLTYPQFTDERFGLADALGHTRIPTTMVFDRAGRVVFVGDGLDRRAVSALAATLDRSPAAQDCTGSQVF